VAPSFLYAALGACIIDESLSGGRGFLEECLDVVLGINILTFYSKLGCFGNGLFEHFHKAGKSVVVGLFGFVVAGVRGLWDFRDGCSGFANSDECFLRWVFLVLVGMHLVPPEQH